jgi:tetratricopeptide (TPR) repeat protein
MAKFFISNTRRDREWTDWICAELCAMGHEICEHSQNLSNLAFNKWMEREQPDADHTVCVYSEEYKKAEFSQMEFERAVSPALKHKRNPCLIIKVRPSVVRFGYQEISFVEVFGKFEDEARAALRAYIDLAVAIKPELPEPALINLSPFPGRVKGNLPFFAPRMFFNRDDDVLFGRGDILRKIKSAFESGDRAYRAVALAGMPGCGKSTIAAAYAEANESRYRACWWIRAAEEEHLTAGLATLADRLGWMQPDEVEGFRVERVCELLETRGRDILLIYDNAIKADKLTPFLPRQTNAHILITSNALDWGTVADHVRVTGWPREKGGEFLVIRVPAPQERPKAEQLSEEMGGLPLALEMAGSYCAQHDISLATYAELYKEKVTQVFGEGHFAPKEYYERRTAAVAFELAIQSATQRHPAAKALVEHLALLAPEAVPLDIFEKGRESLEEPLRTQFDGGGLDAAVLALSSYGLLLRPETKSVRLHRAVRTIVPAKLSDKQREDVRGALIAAVAAAYPSHDGPVKEAWDKARALRTHARELLGTGTAPPAGFEVSASDLMYKFAMFSGASRADIEHAKALLERSLDIRRARLPADDPRIVESLSTLALSVLALEPSDPERQARADAEEAVAICERLNEPDHASLGVPLINLARILHDTQNNSATDFAVDVDRARACCERALELYERNGNAHVMDRAFALSVLGRILTTQKQLEKARKVIDEALRLYRDDFTHVHPAQANNLVTISDILVQKEEYGAAVEMLERALLIYAQSVGPESEGVAKCYEKMGDAYMREGKPAEACRMWQLAHDLSHKIRGPDDPGTQRLRGKLASFPKA